MANEKGRVGLEWVFFNPLVNQRACAEGITLDVFSCPLHLICLHVASATRRRNRGLS